MLSSSQRDLLDRRLPGATVERDHSWGVVQTTVLEVTWRGGRFIVKAGGPDDHHIAREIRAHLHWLTPWTSRGRAPRLVHHDTAAKLLVTTYLPGELLLDSAGRTDPDAFRQAGELLALLHGQEAVVVPTHGDWQPRNWLIHEGVVSVIDFGRAAMRPAYTDLSRLAAQDFRDDPRLEAAFFQGYGSEPRATGAWQRGRMREAIGTACWAFVHGEAEFEAQGHRMIDEALR